MSSQPSGGPSIPAAAAVAGLDTKKGEAEEARDQGVPVGAADAQADAERASESTDSGDDDAPFVNADVDSQSEGGVPVGRADAEQDRLRASSEDDSE